MSGETSSKEKNPKQAHAYTPGLKVKRGIVVSKTRRLPIPGEVYVKVGDSVNHNTVIARTHIRGNPEILGAATLLGVEPEDFERYLTKKVGDRVAKDETIAAFDALFGLIKKRVASPVDGTVEVISNMTGQVIIRGAPIPLDVDAYVPGKVVNVLPKEGAVIETNAAFIQGIFGIGGETHGKIKMAASSPDDEMTADSIAADDKGMVLIGGSVVTLDALKKAVETGVSCIVVGGIRYKDITTFMGSEIGVAITGEEEVSLTLIMTEGFGKIRMSQRIFDLFKSFEGCFASVNGATQIRAGVMRPEIVIPHEKSMEQASRDELAAGMVPGTLVRIIRQPYFGVVGKISDLPVELQQVEAEPYVRVVEVELDQGRVVTVPRANVEIIEE